MPIPQQGTVLSTVKIDVSPDGIRLTMEGLETDLASLIAEAGGFTALDLVYHTYDSSDVCLLSNKKLAFVDRPVPPVTP